MTPGEREALRPDIDAFEHLLQVGDCPYLGELQKLVTYVRSQEAQIEQLTKEWERQAMVYKLADDRRLRILRVERERDKWIEKAHAALELGEQAQAQAETLVEAVRENNAINPHTNRLHRLSEQTKPAECQWRGMTPVGVEIACQLANGHRGRHAYSESGHWFILREPLRLAEQTKP